MTEVQDLRDTLWHSGIRNQHGGRASTVDILSIVAPQTSMEKDATPLETQGLDPSPLLRYPLPEHSHIHLL